MATLGMIDGIEFADGMWKSHLRDFPAWNHLPRDEIGIEDQKRELVARAGVVHWKQHPLLPPYSAAQLSALERKHDFKFPMILRFYLGQISREIVISKNNASLVMSYFNPWRSCRCGHYTIAFSGPSRNYVTYRPFGYNNGGLMTLFHFLVSSLEICMIRRGKMYSCLSDFRRCADVSQAVQEFRCSTSRVSSILKSERDANKTLSVVEPGIKKIQKQFRLWSWRKNVYWNPHTEIGKIGLLITTRAFLSQEAKVLLRRRSGKID